MQASCTAPSVITDASSPAATPKAIWTRNGGSNNWNDCRNWEEGKVPDCDDAVLIPHAVKYMPIVDSCYTGSITNLSGAPLLAQIDQKNLRLNQDAKVMLGELGKFTAQIYPNPTTGLCNLSIETELESEAQLKVFNAQGQLVRLSKHLLVNGQNNLSLDLQTQPKGMYFLVLESNGTRWQTRLSRF